jgi:hypothetical protein
MSTRILAAGVLGGSLIWAAVAAQQEVRPTPGPGSGTMKVTGSVEVSNTPTVEALQAGAWRVTLGETADVRLAAPARVSIHPPGFLRVGGRYTITWPGGEREGCAIEQIGAEGWVRTTAEGRQRWINVAMARSIDALN